MNIITRTVTVSALCALAICVAGDAGAQDLAGPALVTALRGGGYVLVMRHASSPRELPDAATAQADNATRERQLDAAGRSSAAAMGDAWRRLGVAVGVIYTSPTYRARETVRLLGFSNGASIAELGDAGQSMQAAGDVQSEWLQKLVAGVPTQGNIVVVTHMPNIARAFPQAANVADGETLVFRPDGQGKSALVARVTIDAWPRLAR